jgi:chitodextrinase
VSDGTETRGPCAEPQLPAPEIRNRAGLPELAYRVGTQPVFLRRMLAALPRFPGLARLTARREQDAAIGLLDAWATVADVLTFYQERIANEGFLRTATERRSLLELARTVGYELGPGVAATAHLAFTVDDRPPPPGMGPQIEEAVVPKGTKVQSIPEQDQLPQTFETSAELVGRPEWNALRPRLKRPQPLSLNSDHVHVEGVAPGVEAGDRLLITVPRSGGQPTGVDHRVVTVSAVRIESELARTRLDLSPDPKPAPPFVVPQLPPAVVLLDPKLRLTAQVMVQQLKGKVWKERQLRRQIRIPYWKHRDLTHAWDRFVEDFEPFDVLEPDPPPPPPPPPPPAPLTPPTGLAATAVTATSLTLTWTASTDSRRAGYQVRRGGTVLGTTTGTTYSVAGLACATPYEFEVRTLDAYGALSDPAKLTASTAACPSAPPAKTALYAFRETAGFFGNNAPKWLSLPKASAETSRGADPYPRDWDTSAKLDPQDTNPATPRTIWRDSQGNLYGNNRVFLERAIRGLRKLSWAIVDSAAGLSAYWIEDTSEQSRADFGLNARATSLKLLNPDGTTPTESQDKFRDTTAYVRSEQLELAQLPIEDPLRVGDKELVLDRLVLGLDEGQPVALTGARRDLRGVTSSEILFIEDVEHVDGFTKLTFTTGLVNEYMRRTVALNANVVAATHGETIAGEILGGGDGLEANQRFTLAKPPLTYVSSAGAGGSEAALEVRVDGVLWEESPVLYGLGPKDQRYIVRIDDDGKTHVTFGDGKRGARPPTGTENVVATYRSGIGLKGLVPAEKLTLLQTRPLGIKSVLNPAAATGAADPEDRDSARANAPLSVVAMERIVSLRDFEDFARAFAGIGKAQAIDIWRGPEHLIHITVAAANGDEVPATSALHTNLVKAIDAARDPALSVLVDSYARRYFDVAADLVIDSRHVPDRVIAAAEAALEEAFSFRRRDFGQWVSAAEVVTVMQNVEGVVAVDLSGLARMTSTAVPATIGLEKVLTAERARLVGATVEPAELLVLDPAGVNLRQATP